MSRRPAFGRDSQPRLGHPEDARCTAQVAGAHFCDQPSLPLTPFPICLKHAAEVTRYVKELFSPDPRNRPAPVEAQPQLGVIYYLRVGELIKVGFTTQLKARLAAYPPDATLLATEPGTQCDERDRHKLFATALQYGHEWFHPIPELLAYIEVLKSEAEASVAMSG